MAVLSIIQSRNGEFDIALRNFQNTIVGNTDNCDEVIESKINHGKFSLTISPSGKIVNYEGCIYINNIPVEKNMEIKHHSCIAMGDKYKGAMAIFYDAQEEHLKEQEKIIKEINVNEKYKAPENHEVFTVLESFAPECCLDNLKKFCQSTIDFIYKKMKNKIDRAIFYQVSIDQKRWLPLYNVAPEGYYCPPKKLLSRLNKEKKPILYDFEDKTTDNPSLSIVQSRIAQAFLFPLIIKNKLAGVIYLDKIQNDNTSDSVTNELSNKDFLIISALMPQITLGFASVKEKEITKVQEKKTMENLFSQASKLPGINCKYRVDYSDFLLVQKKYNDQRFIIFIESKLNTVLKTSLVTYLQEKLEIESGKEVEAFNQINNYIKHVWPYRKKSISLNSIVIATLNEDLDLTAAQIGQSSLIYFDRERLTFRKTMEPFSEEEEEIDITIKDGDMILILPSSENFKRIKQKLDVIRSKTFNNIQKVLQKEANTYYIQKV